MSDLFLRKEADMQYTNITDEELLALLMGPRKAEMLFKGGTSLSEIFLAATNGDRRCARIAVARELVIRMLSHEMRARDALASPAAVRSYLRLKLSGYEHEAFVVIFLDAQNRVITTEEMFRGTLTQTSVYPREVVKAALKHNAAALILCHNHPSGVAEPSIQDQSLTRTLSESLALIDVKVLDHIIVASNSALSFAERGLL